MKKLILLAALISAPTYAEDDFCLQMHNVGKTIMDARQKGVSLPTMMQTMSGNLKELLKPIVVEAYSHPVYTTPSIKKETVDEFANKLHLECLKHEL
jgi:hypothetical protein